MEGDLEDCFFSPKGKTLIKPDDEKSLEIVEVLKKGLRKGEFIQRGGEPSAYAFNLDRIYDSIKLKERGVHGHIVFIGR
jgi:hypothetical protein